MKNSTAEAEENVDSSYHVTMSSAHKKSVHDGSGKGVIDYLLTVATSPLSTHSRNFFSSCVSWPWALCCGRRGTISGPCVHLPPRPSSGPWFRARPPSLLWKRQCNMLNADQKK
ncbi:hypothetical protein CEXT_189511 [Caerostris extrusa]|uniref:Uncharacterized protein n=1 Tax=Caerostris extrusa TaxID=172846 RepID=A0AAV4VRF6_CAEEX|nr:hypothetical protein CEXT_189511 [Caerostris extrusa]